MSLPLYSTIFPPNFSSLSRPSTLIWTPTWPQQLPTSTSFYQQLQGYYMSQTTSHNSTFTYTPEFFGHPHQISEPQPTEPFQNQYPTWVDPELLADNTSLYYQAIQYPNTTAMSEETTYIGSDTKNGRKLSKPTGRGKVDVWANGTFIQQMPIGVLCRFSKVAAAAFPRPYLQHKAVNSNLNDTSGTVGGDKSGSTTGADDDGDAQRVAAEVAKLKIDSKANGDTSANAGKKELNLYLDTLYLQPPVEAFIWAFKWMDLAKETGRGDRPPEYGVENPERVSLKTLVDMYAVALVLDIRPAINKHRVHVMNKMTEQRPTLATLVYVHEHLPLGDVTMTRFITSFFEHRDRPRSEYTTTEIKQIEDYVCRIDEYLHARFVDIGTAREKRHQQYHDRVKQSRVSQRQAELQRDAERLGNGHVESGGAVFVDAGNGEDKQQNGGLKKQPNGEVKTKGVGSGSAK